MEFIELLTPLKLIYPTVMMYHRFLLRDFLKPQGVKEYAVAYLVTYTPVHCFISC